MKARIWKDQEAGTWCFHVSCGVRGSRRTWGKALSAVREEFGEHQSRPGARQARSGAPGDDALRRFASVYESAAVRQPARAMTAAAETLGISRATANRRAARCREAGYLPDACRPVRV